MSKFDAKQIGQQITGIARSMANTRDAIQSVLPGIVYHACEHGDIRLADRLYVAAKGTDRGAIAKWLQNFGPFTFSAKANGGKGGFKLNAAKRAAMDFDETALADAPKWYDYVATPKQIERSLDVEARVASLIESVERAATDGKAVKNSALVEYLRAAMAKYHADAALASAQQAMVADVEVVELDPEQVDA